MDSFTKDAGRFLNAVETQTMTGAYREKKLASGLSEDEYVRSEYFGLNQIKQLMNQPGCVGLRVHQAKRWEDADGKPTKEGKGQLKPRVLLTGVDKDGKDLPVQPDKQGLKDMPNDSGQGGSLGDGMPCPQMCGK